MVNNDVKKILITEEEIYARSKAMAAQIDEDYKDVDNLVLVGILKGSVPFMAELMKHIQHDLALDFLVAKSYQGTESLGDIKIVKDLDDSIVGKHVLLVEDIVDTGFTIKELKQLMYNKGAADVKVATLLDKPSRRKVNVEADYIGFQVENEFVIGFGMDYNQKYRNLPYVGVLKDELY